MGKGPTDDNRKGSWLHDINAYLTIISIIVSVVSIVLTLMTMATAMGGN